LTAYGSMSRSWERELVPTERRSQFDNARGEVEDDDISAPFGAHASASPLSPLSKPGDSGSAPYPPPEGYSSLYGSEPPTKQRANVSFAFLYSLARDYDYMLAQEDVHYIMAEAVFTLAATGISEADSFRRVVADTSATYLTAAEEMQAQAQREGSLGVCMIRYPRASAEIYWIDRLASETLVRWASHAEAERPGDAESRRQAQQRNASALVERTLQPWFLDPTQVPPQTVSVSLPGDGAGPQRIVQWPTRAALAALAPDTNAALDLLHQALTNIKRQLDYNAVIREMQKRAAITRRTPPWSESAQQAFSRAQDSYRNLQNASLQAWKNVQQEAHRQIEHMVDDLWLGANTSWLEAHAFTEAVDKELGDVLVRLSDMRIERHDAYQARMERYHRMVRNVPDPTETSGSGADGGDFQTFVPRHGDTTHPGTPSNGPAFGAKASASGAPPATDPSGRGAAPPDAEEALSRQLVRRVDLLAQRLPRIPTLIATVLAAFPASFLLAQANLPTSLSSTPTEMALMGAGVGLFLGSLGALHKFWQSRTLTRARRDSLKMRNELLQHHYSLRTNQLSVGAVMLTRRDVQDMRALLANWPGRLRDIAQGFNEEAVNEEKALFDGAIGRQDVLVANGEEMRNFSVVYYAADTQRIRSPHAEWHRDYDAISGQLRQELRQRREGVVGLQAETFKKRIQEFLHRHFVRYLHEESIAAIHQAIDEDTNVDARQVWQRAQSRAAPLRDVPGRDEDYVAGIADDLASLRALGVAPTATVLTTRDCDRTKQWLLVAKLRHR
ncbi:MAG TPA: hypothetical protein VFS83_12855, partial [Ktedonobacterales bacterium]|nr:hypothetical protein [Ktedonobacterales bacterium]